MTLDADAALLHICFDFSHQSAGVFFFLVVFFMAIDIVQPARNASPF